MTSEGRLSSPSIRAAVDHAGVDWRRLESDLDGHDRSIGQALGRTSRYAAMAGLSGTPAVMIGPYLLPGAADLATLKRTVALAREAE